jgi:hypothetical protein
MKHNFCCRLIHTLPTSLLAKLKDLALTSEYHAVKDFPEDVLWVTKFNLMRNDAMQELFQQHLSKFFRLDGHISTNIVKMFPNSYLYQHKDSTGSGGAAHERTIKLQIPLLNADRSAMMWLEDRGQVYPKTTVVSMAEGGVHIIDNIKLHCSVNLDTNDRYFLTPKFWADSLINPATVA